MKGEAQEYVSLEGCASPQALAAAVAAHAAAHPRKSWVVGVGWDQSAWGRYPTRQDLDAALPTRPVVLYRACWHIVVANSCALRAAGLSLEEPFVRQLVVVGVPPRWWWMGLTRIICWMAHASSVHQLLYTHAKEDGEGEGVDVDARGILTGILRETAVTRVTSHIVEHDEATREGHYRSALARCLHAGITAVQTNDTKAWRLYHRLQATDELALRVFLTINHEEMEEDPSQARPIAATPDSLLARPRIKLYAGVCTIR